MRVAELRASAAVLGLASANVHVVDARSGALLARLPPHFTAAICVTAWTRCGAPRL